MFFISFAHIYHYYHNLYIRYIIDMENLYLYFKEVTFHCGRSTRGRDGRAHKVANEKAQSARIRGKSANPTHWEELRESVREALFASQASAVEWRRRCIEANNGGNTGRKRQFDD